MKLKCLLILVLVVTLAVAAFSQENSNAIKVVDISPQSNYKYSLRTSWLCFLNFGEESTNTQHYEFHFRYKLTDKDFIGIKFATWKLFATMGMPLGVQLQFDRNKFYPGRLKETGLGVAYQRMLWKGLFGAIEILPQRKTYTDLDKNVIGHGFKLYSSYHVGYQFLLCNNRVVLEPQMHCQYWPIDIGTPEAFKKMDDAWHNYFLYEPNLYIGINF